jgi:hypothetical protein
VLVEVDNVHRPAGDVLDEAHHLESLARAATDGNIDV